MKIAIAKQRLSIPALMSRLGIAQELIPQSPTWSSRCPWPSKHNHGDRKPSFSVYADGQKATCFACGFDVDGPDFLQRWLGCSKREACNKFVQMAKGVCLHLVPRSERLQRHHQVVPLSPLALPTTDSVTDIHISHLAALRRIDKRTLFWATQLGALHFANVCGHPSWLLTDPTLYVAEARRMDGAHFPAFGSVGERKAHSLAGSVKSWPLGTGLLSRFPSVPTIMLVEGGPDYLAALQFLMVHQRASVLPAAMLGRSVGLRGIHSEALALLRGRRVRIYPHNDPDGGGLRSAKQWEAQLCSVGCTVDLFNFGTLREHTANDIKDLNDLAAIFPQGFPSVLPI